MVSIGISGIDVVGLGVSSTVIGPLLVFTSLSFVINSISCIFVSVNT